MGPVAVDEYYLAACLDDKWRAVPSIKRLAKRRWNLCQMVDALRRLADGGTIERREQSTDAFRSKRGANGSEPRTVPMKIEFYRRRQ